MTEWFSKQKINIMRRSKLPILQIDIIQPWWRQWWRSGYLLSWLQWCFKKIIFVFDYKFRQKLENYNFEKIFFFNPLRVNSKTQLTLSDISDDVSDDDRGIFSCKSATVLLSPFISPLTESKKKILIRRISLLTNVPKNKSQLWTWSKGAYYECLKPTLQNAMGWYPY